jgi:hypothetical protein
MFALVGSDIDVYPFPSSDDPRLVVIHKKGFAEAVKKASKEEIWGYANLFPAWYYKKLRNLPIFLRSDASKVKVFTPKLRSHRKGYYYWIKHIPLPEGGYWYLLTLTLYRSISIEDAWKNINHWTSAFLHRFRKMLYRKYGVDLTYLWVVEVHMDGYPHVHILFSMSYVKELNFSTLLRLFQSFWVDDDGRPLCASQGVDLKYIGKDVSQVKAYVLKYLVKNHHKYWRFAVNNGMVAVRKSTRLIWLFRVRLFGMSQNIRRPLKVSPEDKEKLKWYGNTSANVVHKLFYKQLGIPFDYWIWGFIECGSLEYDASYLPALVPSAFPSSGPSLDDDYYGLLDDF